MSENWTEILANRGVDVGHITDTVKAAEKKQQEYQKALHERTKQHHDSELHGLTIVQVQAIVKDHLTAAQYEFCGEDFATQLWDQL